MSYREIAIVLCIVLVAEVLLAAPLTAQTTFQPFELPNSADARCSASDNSLCFHLESAPPDGRLTFPRLNNVVRLVAWRPDSAPPVTEAESRELRDSEYRPPQLTDPQHVLSLSQTPREWTITLKNSIQYPAQIVVETAEPPLHAPAGFTCRATPDLEIVLPARHAQVTGDKLQFEPLTHKNTVGYWVEPEAHAWWLFATEQADQWDVHVLQGCGGGQGGSLIKLDFGSDSLDYRVVETGHFQNFRWRHAGTVQLDAAGDHRLTVSCVELARNAVMDIRQIRLVPSSPRRDTPLKLADTLPDCVPPRVTAGDPRAGQRVLRKLEGSSNSDAYHALYLPTNWNGNAKWPVLVEWGGNGPYLNSLGDTNSGRVEDGQLGYGLAGNDDYVWLSLPYLNQDGTRNVSQWWGNPPKYSPAATLAYAQQAIDDVCEKFGGNREQLVLIGFSRGAIACNYLGLHDDQIASQWRAFVCFSHYDGISRWPYPESDEAAARQRLRRLAGRPQLIISESTSQPGEKLAGIRTYLEDSPDAGAFTFLETGFVNHDDDWTLRPSPARQQAREWLRQTLDLPARDESR